MNIDLLLAISNGELIFKPIDGDIEAFQPTAHDLLELEHEGYIIITRKHREDSSGRRNYNLIMVRGMTDHGIEYLQE